MKLEVLSGMGASVPDAARSEEDDLEPTDPLAADVDEAALGDPRALARVLEAVAPAVVGVTRTILGFQHPDVEDVAQESLAAVHDALGRFRGESSFVHYARRIAVRVALATRREAAAAPRAEWPVEEVAAHDELVTDRMARERRLAAFQVLLDELPAQQRESFALRVLLGHSLPQVAEATGAPLNTVRSRIRLAKEHIRERIASDPRLADLFEVKS